MRRVILSVALVLCGVLCLGAQSSRRYALVIGNGNYAELGRLKNPANDAEDMAKALRELGFEVKLLVDADLASMEDAVIRLGNSLAQNADSVGFFFYAGHGVQSGGINYLIPSDARIASETFLKTKALAAQSVLESLQSARNSLNIVVLDACRDNPFSWGRSGQRGLSVVSTQPPGSIIAYATSAGSIAQDGSGRNGVFTAELLKNLRTKGVEIKDVFNRTGKAVTSSTAGKQVPAIYNQFFDEAFLAGRANAPAATPAPAAPPAAAVTVIPKGPTVTVLPSTGSIIVSTATAGTLYLDGKALVELPAGSEAQLDSIDVGDRSLELRYPSGERETKTIRVTKGATANASFTWTKSATGTLVVTSDPAGATVTINGRERGRTPLTLSDLSVGDVTVVVSQSGYEDIQQAKRIEAGQTTQASYVLRKKVAAAPVTPPAAPTAPSGSVAVSVKGGFARIPAHSYLMGAPITEKDSGSTETPQHEVRLSAYWIGQYEVSQAEWREIMGTTPAYFKDGEKLPVENVNWYDTLVYCNRRSIKEGLKPCYTIKGSTDPERWGPAPRGRDPDWDAASCNFSANGYRLPTEAEWENACRAGTKSAVSFGDSLASTQANFNGFYPYNTTTTGAFIRKTSPVGSYAPNAWGIYDMHGNVWEWCWDWSGKYEGGSQADPTGPGSGTHRVLRGGSWLGYGNRLRSATRYYYNPESLGSEIGFRVVRSNR